MSFWSLTLRDVGSTARGVAVLVSSAGLAVAAMFCVLAAGTAHAADGSGDLSDLILNLSRYTSWPASPTRKQLTVCYAHGGAMTTSALVTDQNVSIRGLPVQWRQIATPAQIPGCMVLWLNADVRPAPRDWLAVAADQPILTLSNYADFTADGGVVGAYRVGADWRFEINLEALQRTHLNIAAAALRLSQKPKAAPGTGESR